LPDSATPSNRRPFIEYRDVSVQYSELVQGLKNVSLTIEQGEFLFLCGATGSGKSTLLKLLTREVEQTSGEVWLNGQCLQLLKKSDIPFLRRQMGIVPQDFGLLPNKRVWENVSYAMRAIGKTKRDVRRTVPQVLESVDIAHRADAYPRELSGGEQQRVAIGRALINHPPLLLADEPTGNLDPEHSLEIIRILENLNRKGATVVIATHDQLIVEKVARRVIHMDKGQIVREVNPRA